MKFLTAIFILFTVVLGCTVMITVHTSILSIMYNLMLIINLIISS